jgi:hypothetical protein
MTLRLASVPSSIATERDSRVRHKEGILLMLE